MENKVYNSTQIEPCLINPLANDTWVFYPKSVGWELGYSNVHWEDEANTDELNARYAPFIIPEGEGEKENAGIGIYAKQPNGRTLYVGRQVFDIEGKILQLLEPVALICQANYGWYAMPYDVWEMAVAEIATNEYLDDEKYNQYHAGMTLELVNLYADFSDVQEMQDDKGFIHYVNK